MLKTLEIYEVVSIAQADKRRAVLKRQVRDVASAARRLANGLRRRMNEQQVKVAVATSGPGCAGALPCDESTPDAIRSTTTDEGERDLREEGLSSGADTAVA
jgi:hypothetical protein